MEARLLHAMLLSRHSIFVLSKGEENMSEFKSLDSAGISYLWKKIAQAIDGGG